LRKKQADNHNST